VVTLFDNRFSDVRRFAEVDSTNRVAADLVRGGAVDGLVVVADHQTAGRGRQGRRWESEPGTSLLVSVVLRPVPALVTLAAGVAAAEACAAVAGAGVRLKWPNDVMADEGKLGGILSELVGDAAIVGLGMNLGSILLVLTGTFFYVAFNVLSGAAAIPKEMNEAADVLGLRGTTYLKRVFVPAILPSLVTGCVTAWGGGWNAIIFSEYVVAAGKLYSVRGIGATLDRATYVTGDLQLVTLSLVSMVALVILVNRLFWDPLYQHVAARYKLEA